MPKVCCERGCAHESSRIMPLAIRCASCFAGVLVEACAEADRRLAEDQDAAAAARAARTPKEIELKRRTVESNSRFLSEIGGGGRRQRPDIAYEVTNEIVIELLALLGPDLGNEGEAILRRVAQDAPSWLAPAVEDLFAGRARRLLSPRASRPAD